ncbi:MAG: ChaN family lipoprotein [Armatimonadetes bacterium]|nr:ChaN family lipoprotein [Armatimonadota bacterium]
MLSLATLSAGAALALGVPQQPGAAAQQKEAPNPLTLAIGRPGQLVVKPGEIMDTRSSRSATIADIVKAAEGKRFVYLGESHTNAQHHQMQADVIVALAKSGRQVIVGFEQFTRPVQLQLNPWTLGWWSEEQFIKNADWKGQWGYDYAFYRPIFEATKQYRLPMVALNVPRDWVRAVGRGGPNGLPADAKSQVPELDVTNKDHREVFFAMIGGHPPGSSTQMDNMYSAQVLWDTAMADSALKYLAQHPTTSNTVFVVIAGSGHVMYEQAINYRIFKRTGEKGVTVVMVGGKEPVTVSRGIGDFVFCGGSE